MSEVEEIRRKFEHQYRKKIPDAEVRFSSNIYGAVALHPMRLPSKMPQEQKNIIYGNWDNSLKSHGLRDSEIQNLDRTKIAIFMPTYYQHNPTLFYATLCEELGHNVAYSYGIQPKVPNEGVALACRFKGLLEAAKEGKFPLNKVIEQIEDDIKQQTHGPFAIFMHYYKALDFIRRYNPSLEFKTRKLDDLIQELSKSLDYMFKTSERIKWDMKRLLEKAKSMLRERDVN